MKQTTEVFAERDLDITNNQHLNGIMAALLKRHAPLALLRSILDTIDTDNTEYLESEQFGIAICKAEITQCADTIQKRLAVAWQEKHWSAQLSNGKYRR